MRTLADSGLRTNYLSSLVVPKGRLIVDRWLPRFESALHSSSDSVITGSAIGEDYIDVASDSHWLWGDSDKVTSTGTFSGICRIVSPHIADSETLTLYKSWWTVASPSWTFAATASLPSGYAMTRYCRPGVRNKNDGTVYFWFLDNATKHVCRVPYNPATNAWGTVTEITADSFTGTIRSLAIHPTGDDSAAVVSLIDNRFMVTYLMGVGGGSYYRRNLVIGQSDDYTDDMAVWSDAEKVPSDTTRVVILFNTSSWPIPRTCRVMTRGTKCVIGAPRMAVPADPDWGNMRVKPISLSVIGNWLEAVLYREPIDSNGDAICPHTIIASSYNGHGWHEDVLATRADCRGKFLYAGSGQYGHVVANVAVARCTAGAQQGSDYSGIRQTLGTVTSLSLSHDGPGSAPSIQATVPDPDNTFLATGLVAPENRVRVYLGDDRLTAEGWGLIHTGEITDVTPTRSPGARSLQINALGMSQRVFGDGSYKPASSINLLAPRTEQSRFQFETGEARLTVIAKDGTWETTDGDTGGYYLQCEAGGTALFAEELTNPQFFARFRMRYRTKLRGAYLLFWYEDESNYYRAGLRNTEAAGGWLEIDRCVDGVVTNLVSETLAALAARDTWFTLMLSCTANNLTVYYMDGGEYDYSTAYDSANYALDTDDLGAPASYSLGLQLTEFDPLNSDSDVRTAYYVGTVTDADADWLEDTGYTWTDQQAESYLYLGDAYHKIASYDTEAQKYTIEDYWGEAPSVGASYGIVAGWLVPGPTLQVYSAFFCEMVRPMSAEDIGTWVLDACGVVRDWGSTSTLPQFDDAGSAVFMRDVQIDVVGTVTTSSGPEIAIWGKSQRKDADADYDATAVRIKLYSDHASVDYNRVSSGTPTSWISVHPYPAYSTLESGTEYQFRLQACQDGIYVSVGDRLLAAFPAGLGAETLISSEGFCGYLSGSGTYREFPAVSDVTWDTAENASSFLSRVFQGFNLRPIERADGSMRLGRQYDPLGDLGEWYTTVTKLETQKTRAKAALLELAGAENLTFYLNESQAYDSLSFDRQDNPNLWSIPGLEFEARRLSERAEEQQNISRVTLHAPDPAAELDDRVEVDGEHYRIEGVKMSLSRGMNDLKFDTSFKARLEDLSHFTAGTWGTSVWGAFQWSE